MTAGKKITLITLILALIIFIAKKIADEVTIQGGED